MVAYINKNKNDMTIGYLRKDENFEATICQILEQLYKNNWENERLESKLFKFSV